MTAPHFPKFRTYWFLSIFLLLSSSCHGKDLRTEEDNSYKNRVIHSVHSNVQHKAYSNSVPETILRNVSKDHLTTEPPLLENSDGINHGENESVAIPQFVDISSRRNNERESEATGKKVEEAVYQVQVPDRYTALEGPLTVTIMKGTPPGAAPVPAAELEVSVLLLHSPDVLGKRLVGPVVQGVHYTTTLPCGVIVQGGAHVIRLSLGTFVLTESVLLVRWPTVTILPPTPHEPISARFKTNCNPMSRRPMLTCAELLYHGTINRSRSQTFGTQPAEIKQKRLRHRRSSLIAPVDDDMLSESNLENNVLEPKFRRPAQKFCAPPLYVNYQDDSSSHGSGYVIERVQLKSLYSRGRGTVKFDCRHLSDNSLYSTRLTANLPASPVLGTSTLFTVSWSDVVTLNISAGYMKECHSSIAVTSSQDICLSTVDKIRIYARVPLSVDSVNPPIDERYVSEYRVGSSPVNIPCSLFSEGPSHYCFVYIRTAASGAVTEVARLCRPTLRPGVAVRHGVWSNWTSWSECVPPCGQGQRMRYRYCDSPPPMNKGRYCQGNSTSVKPCNSAPCDVTTRAPTRPPTRKKSCSCGCLLTVPKGGALKLDTDNTQCINNATWIIKTERTRTIEAVVSHASLLAGRQWLKIRDGNSSTSPLLLTLPSSPDAGHLVFPLHGITHHFNIRNVTSAESQKEWEMIKEHESKTNPSWHITSSSHWLRLDIHTFVNISNIDYPPIIGFSLIARISSVGWISPLEEPLFSEISSKDKGTTFLTFINITAFFFVVAIICLIAVFIGIYRLQYTVYQKSKIDNKSLCDSIGSSTDLSDHNIPERFSSLTTIAEVLSLASFSFNKRDSSANYTQLTDRNCVPLRSKPGCISMPSSPFCGRAPSSTSFLRVKRSGRRFEKNRRSASCDELESRFIFPIQEEIMTSSLSETELSSSNKDDSGNESLKSGNKKAFKKGVIKKPQTNKGSFAYITKVKSLGGNLLRKNSGDKNSQFPKSKTRLKLNLKRSSTNENNQSPLPAARIASMQNASSTSELSMAGADLEFDYYDYNMENASAVPGSLFGLDPTLMPWLPSILNIDELDGDTEVIYSSQRHPFTASQTTLTKESNGEAECIPLQTIVRPIAPDTQKEGTPVSCQSTDLSASKAISLSSTDNSDEIPFADDSDEDI